MMLRKTKKYDEFGEYLRAETILAAASNAGRKVAVVTAKEKLRDILSHKMKGIAYQRKKQTRQKKKHMALIMPKKLSAIKHLLFIAQMQACLYCVPV